ncbi:hypothetical protein HYH02_001200 [Chlamydomonas schloesseri]|uniref:TOG domain-containing protein n=1 Tax=Chlamydomonas schloesseri TaxID=2026947 RepID=A0A835WUX0_9CHLO|nr:hypothetical protein HYH02_001200 [Chlamydomonas schloesseri]|eukprot:KAG2454165.1 hypothetical protein HYH02_001200 [Chlamydomonas schloesseri]
MSGAKKSVDEIWKELNAPKKPTQRAGVAGLAVGLGGLPGITSIVRTLPSASSMSSTAPAAAASSSSKPETDNAASVSGPHLAAAVPSGDAAAYLATLQRTINCLADPDRGLRRSAASTLQDKLFKGDAATPAATPSQLRALLAEPPAPLLRPLVAMMGDSVERCRAVALTVLLDGGKAIVDAAVKDKVAEPAAVDSAAAAGGSGGSGGAVAGGVEALAALLPDVVPEMARRFGALPVQEPAEEVRLQIIQLAALLLEAAPAAALTRFAPDLEAVLCRGLEDGFPDIKKAACSCIESACRRLPFSEALEPAAERLLVSLAPNLQHQHSRVRLAAIQALDALVGAGTPMSLVEGSVVPALRPVGHDRAQQVREAAFAALARWMGYNDHSGGGAAAPAIDAGSSASAAPPATPQQAQAQRDARAYVPSLLPLLLIGVSDPQPGTAELALRLVEGVGSAWAAAEDAATAAAAATAAGTDAATAAAEDVGAELRAAADELALRVAACSLGAPYGGRPGDGARRMVRALLAEQLPPLVKGLSEWTAGLRVAAARGLHTTLVLAEDGAAAHLKHLLPALCSAIADEEVDVASHVMACVHVVGAHVSAEDWLPRMLDTLSASTAAAAAAAASGITPIADAPTSASSGTATAAAAAGPGSSTGGSMSISQRTQTLVVLSGLLHAAGRARRRLPPTLLARLAATLAEEPMLAAAAEHGAVRQQLLAATVNTLSWAGVAAGAADVALPLHVVLLQLYGSELGAAAAAARAAPVPFVGGQRGSGAAAAAAAAAAVAASPAAVAAVGAMGTLAAACRSDAGSAGGGTDVDAASARAASTSGAAELVDLHKGWILSALLDGPAATAAAANADGSACGGSAQLPGWRARPGDATWMCVLRAALHTASPAALSGLAPALVTALGPLVGDKDRPASLRLSLLELVDGLLEDPERGPAMSSGAGQALITDVLMPPLVWHAGKTAAAVRYAAVTALATLLGRRLPDPRHVLLALEPPGSVAALPAAAQAGAGAGAVAVPQGLLPLLTASLDEDWYTDLRLAACYVAEQLLEVAGPSLSDASRRALYPELHKRLDDAHNSVRVAACGALRAFVRAAGASYCDTNSGYLVAGVIIHMDDSDPAVQEAACAVLLEAAAVKPGVTGAEVRKVRDRFRAKHYCDRVLAACGGDK